HAHAHGSSSSANEPVGLDAETYAKEIQHRQVRVTNSAITGGFRRLEILRNSNPAWYSAPTSTALAGAGESYKCTVERISLPEGRRSPRESARQTSFDLPGLNKSSPRGSLVLGGFFGCPSPVYAFTFPAG